MEREEEEDDDVFLRLSHLRLFSDLFSLNTRRMKSANVRFLGTEF